MQYLCVVDEGAGPNGESVALKSPALDKVTRPTLEHEFYKALAVHD
jgi:hypothetical protein